MKETVMEREQEKRSRPQQEQRQTKPVHPAHELDDKAWRAKVKERNQAQKKSQKETRALEKGGGSDLDAEIEALDARVTSLEQRVTVLEQGGGTEPEPPDPEPPEPEPGDKRFPDKGDPMCGVPAGTSLQQTGGMTVSQDGAKISGKKFTGRVTVQARNVEIFNCEFDCSDWWAVDVKGDDCVVHHCTITSTSTMGASAINTNDGTHVHHCRFRGFENHFNVAGDRNVIEWNDGCDMKSNSEAHYDVLQADGGTSGHIIRNNRFDVGNYGQTAATMIDNYFGPISDVLIENNFLGGGGYPCYIDGSFKGASNATNIRYLNNVCRPGQWGVFYWRDAGSGCRHEGNVHYQTGESVD